MKEAERCKSVCEGDQCEKESGHRGKHGCFHDSEGNFQCCTWTTAGAQRVNRETEKQSVEN